MLSALVVDYLLADVKKEVRFLKFDEAADCNCFIMFWFGSSKLPDFEYCSK